MSHITFCGNCLREVVLPDHETLYEADKKPDGNALCQCGGDVCDCYGCMETLQALRNGERDYQKLDLQRPIDHKLWTPEFGLYEPITNLSKYDFSPSPTDRYFGWIDNNTGKNYRLIDRDGEYLVYPLDRGEIVGIQEHA